MSSHFFVAVPFLPGVAFGAGHLQTHDCPGGFHVQCQTDCGHIATEQATALPPWGHQPSPQEESRRDAEGCRIAVMVGGVIDRFYPLTLLRHVVRPAVRAGCSVDLFFMLFPALQDGAFKSHLYRPVPNPLVTNVTSVQLEEYVMRHARKSGVRRAIFYRQNFLRLDELPRDPLWSRWFRHGERGHPGLTRDLLWLQNIEMLWNWTRGFEESTRYTHLALARSDLHWVDDVDLELFADPARVYSRRSAGALCKKPRTKEDSPDDKFMVVGRRVADAVLHPYTAYFNNLDPQLDGVQSNGEFLGAVARLTGVAWKYVRKDLMPYFPALHMQQQSLKEPFLCLRGARMRHLMLPEDTCVHHSKVRLPFCEDFPLE